MTEDQKCFALLLFILTTIFVVWTALYAMAQHEGVLCGQENQIEPCSQIQHSK